MRGRQLLERRKRMLTLRSQGVPLRTIIVDLSKEHELSMEALYIDWGKRGKWASQVARLQDPTFIDQLVTGLKQIIPNAWYEYKTNTNPSVKLGALKLLKETYMDIIKTLQSLGVAVKIPSQAEVILKWAEYDPEDTTHKISATRRAAELSQEQS